MGEEKASKAVAVKAFNDKFNQHFDAIQKHLSAEAEIKDERKTKKIQDMKAAKAAARNAKAKAKVGRVVHKAARVADKRFKAVKSTHTAKQRLPPTSYVPVKNVPK